MSHATDRSSARFSSPCSTAAALACFAVAARPARAQTYTDVPSGYWARGAIDWVTNVGPLGRKAHG